MENQVTDYFQKVVLYYPNNWRRYIGDLATPDEKKFNWFLCSKKYIDPCSGHFVAEMGRGVKYYSEESGKTFVVPLLDGPDDESKILLLLDDGKGDLLRVIDIIKKCKYKGYARLERCELSQRASDTNFLCKEASFYFLQGVLVESKKERFCPIVDFSKRNNTCIKKLVPDFPDVSEIDWALDKYDSGIVCKVLYEYIHMYLTKL